MGALSMIDHGEQYWQDIDLAHGNFSAALDRACTAMRDECERAWYAYQVRVGMIPAPPKTPIRQEQENGAEKASPDSVIPRPDQLRRDPGQPQQDSPADGSATGDQV